MSDESSAFAGRPARLRFEGWSYMLDPDERQAFREANIAKIREALGA